jgi:Protein of unknown function (DUF3500)
MDWLPERLIQMREAALEHAAGQFTGITTDGSPLAGLFPLRPSGVSTAAITAAAQAYLASLDEAQRATGQLPIDANEWLTWSNISPYVMRHGLLLEDLSEQQRSAALTVVQESLSASGYETTRNVMRLNYRIGELTGSWDEYGEWVYFMTIFGTPSPIEPWGWQIDGHHCNLNCVIIGDQLVLSPAFLGSEPVYADGGKFAGTRVFEAEERSGLELMRALSPALRARASIEDRFGPNESHIQAGAQQDNQQLPYAGIRFMDMSEAARQRLLELVRVYTDRVRPGHDGLRLDEIKAHLEDTYFAWFGGIEDDSVFYYRVHSPVTLIEFDHQSGVVFDNATPARIHIHTVVRTPNGNDYGKDLLRQHYGLHHRDAFTTK